MERGLTVFLPLYNEQEILERNTERVLEYLKRFDLPSEIILGSNGSSDETPRIGQELAARHPMVTFFHIDLRGPGRAYVEAVKRARYAWFFCLDADLSFEMAFLDNALAELEDGADAVIGSKIQGRQQRSFARIIASACFIRMTNLLLRMPWTDYSIGAKAYRTEAIRPYLDKMDTHTFYTQQMLFELRRRNAKIVQIPVQCEDRRASRFNLLHEGFYRYGKLFALWARSLFG